MSIPTHFGTGDGFEQLSEDFMVWLKRCPGFTLNPSLKIVDLRLNGAGRGVSMFFPMNLELPHKEE